MVLASANAGKLREFGELLAGFDLELVAQSVFGLTSAAETAPTFVENALLKARHAARGAGLPALADDSGLVVPALDGAPGVLSARYAGPGASDQHNINKLLAALQDVAPAARACRFVCTLVYLEHAEDPMPLIAFGEWHGSVLAAPRGEGGFGYDPVFGVTDRGCSAAELTPAEKNRRSHRGAALRALAAAFRRQA